MKKMLLIIAAALFVNVCLISGIATLCARIEEKGLKNAERDIASKKEAVHSNFVMQPVGFF